MYPPKKKTILELNFLLFLPCGIVQVGTFGVGAAEETRDADAFSDRSQVDQFEFSQWAEHLLDSALAGRK